jgi:hypothetical protein
MGMDVFGQNPDCEVGKYFRQNVWGWHSLWQYVEDRFPEIARKVPDAHWNNGHGLDSQSSRELGQLLVDDIGRGEALRYVIALDQMQSSAKVERTQPEWVERERSLVAEATFSSLAMVFGDEDDLRAEFASVVSDLSGMKYELDVSMIQAFAEFLQHSGGFQIW